MSYPSSWESDVVLKDGQTVRVRPIEPMDSARLVRFHERQSPESIYFRFFTPLPRLSKRDVEHFTHVDHTDRVAFVAVLADELVGVARYERYSGTDTAEVAFFVDDAHHGRGLGTVLLEYLVAAGRYRELRRFTASTLPNNRAMLAVFRSAGYNAATSMEDGVISVSFDLDETEESVQVADRRRKESEAASVSKLFSPESVVVIGSGEEDDLASRVLSTIVAGGFRGTIDAIEIANINSLREGVDLAIVSAPISEMADLIEQCGQKAVKVVVVASSGFRGAAQSAGSSETTLVETARKHGVRVLGPNCLALVNTDPEVMFNATDGLGQLAPGPIAMLAESGGLAGPIVEFADRASVGISTFVAAGNRADVGAVELLSFWTDDPRTDAVLLYLRASDLPTRFVRAARAASLQKPVVALGQIVASGESPDSARQLAAALTRQTGVINVSTMEQLLDIGRLLSVQPAPSGSGVAVVGNSDGAVEIASAACLSAGLNIVELGQADTRLPNPTLLAPDANAEDYAAALSGATRSNEVHSVLIVHSPINGAIAEELDRVVVDASSAAPEVTFSITMLGAAGKTTLRAPGEAPESTRQVPVFRFPEQAASATARLANYRDWAENAATQSLSVGASSDISAAREVAMAALTRVGGDRASLSYSEQAAMLDTFGVKLARRSVVSSVEEAVAAGNEIGWPVSLKGAARDRSTRSVASGVALDLHNSDELELVWKQMVENWGSEFFPGTVQKMVEGRFDAAITISQSPNGSGTIEVGLGGSAAHADRGSMGLLPLTLGDAQTLVGSSSLARVLTDRLDRVPVVGLLHRLALLVETVDEIEFLRADPVVVSDVDASVTDVVVEVGYTSGDLDVRKLD